MYHELNIYNSQLSEKDALSALLESARWNINGICIPIYFVKFLKESLPDNIVLSTPIGYPDGMSDDRVKDHAILNAIRHGIKTIDVVPNPNYIINKKWDLIRNGLKSHLNICEDKKTTLRIMMEYRDYEMDTLLYLASILTDLNISYVFPSTGHKIDHYSDNLLAAKEITKKYPLKMIVNGNIWQSAQYKTIKQSGVYGVRFNSINAIQNCLGGVQ